MSKYDISPQFVCQSRILNVRIRYSAQVQMSKSDFECQYAIFPPDFEFQNRILNFKI